MLPVTLQFSMNNKCTLAQMLMNVLRACIPATLIMKYASMRLANIDVRPLASMRLISKGTPLKFLPVLLSRLLFRSVQKVLVLTIIPVDASVSVLFLFFLENFVQSLFSQCSYKVIQTYSAFSKVEIEMIVKQHQKLMVFKKLYESSNYYKSMCKDFFHIFDRVQY